MPNCFFSEPIHRQHADTEIDEKKDNLTQQHPRDTANGFPGKEGSFPPVLLVAMGMIAHKLFCPTSCYGARSIRRAIEG